MVIIAGKDKGKQGSVIVALPRESRIVVEGINMKKRHERSRKGGQKGQIIEKSLSIHVSNAMLVDPKGGRTRVRIERKDGKRVRVATKSGTTL